MIKRLNKLNKKRKEVLKFIDTKKIDFNSSSRIIPIEAIKCKGEKWIRSRELDRNFHFSSRKLFFKAHPRMFKNATQVNIALVEFIEDLVKKVRELCIEYYYFIQDNKLGPYKVGKRITPNNPMRWINFFNTLFVIRTSSTYGIRKNRVFFLLKIDDVLRKMIKNNK